MRRISADFLRFRRAVNLALWGAELIQPEGSICGGFVLTEAGAGTLASDTLQPPAGCPRFPRLLCELLGAWQHWAPVPRWDVTPPWVGALHTTSLLDEAAAYLAAYRAEAGEGGPAGELSQLRAEAAALRAEAERLRDEAALLRGERGALLAELEELRAALPAPPLGLGDLAARWVRCLAPEEGSASGFTLAGGPPPAPPDWSAPDSATGALGAAVAELRSAVEELPLIEGEGPRAEAGARCRAELRRLRGEVAGLRAAGRALPLSASPPPAGREPGEPGAGPPAGPRPGDGGPPAGQCLLPEVPGAAPGWPVEVREGVDGWVREDSP